MCAIGFINLKSKFCLVFRFIAGRSTIFSCYTGNIRFIAQHHIRRYHGYTNNTSLTPTAGCNDIIIFYCHDNYTARRCYNRSRFIIVAYRMRINTFKYTRFNTTYYIAPRSHIIIVDFTQFNIISLPFSVDSRGTGNVTLALDVCQTHRWAWS